MCLCGRSVGRLKKHILLRGGVGGEEGRMCDVKQHHLWKRDVLGMNYFVNNCTASVNVRSLFFGVIYNCRI